MKNDMSAPKRASSYLPLSRLVWRVAMALMVACALISTNLYFQYFKSLHSAGGAFNFKALQHDSPRFGSYNATLGFGRIYVINLPNRMDRKADMILLGEYAGLKLTFIEGVDGSTLKGTSATKSNGMTSTLGEFGCKLSHAKVYERMINDNVETALILEDDVDFITNFKERISVVMSSIPKDWGMLYLGSTGGTEDWSFGLKNSQKKQMIIRAFGAVGNFGYAITRETALKLLPLVFASNDPIDYAIVRALSADAIVGYSAYPHIVVVRSKSFKSNIRSDGDSRVLGEYSDIDIKLVGSQARIKYFGGKIKYDKVHRRLTEKSNDFMKINDRVLEKWKNGEKEKFIGLTGPGGINEKNF